MRADYFIQSGQVVKIKDTTQDRYGLFDLGKWLKKMLTRFGVPYSDPCCTPGTPDNVNTNLPIYYNQATNHFYYVNPTTGNPVQITAF